MLKFVLVLAFVPAILCTTGINSCTTTNNNGAVQPAYINIPNCDATPCDIALGSTVTLQVGWTAPREIVSFSPNAKGVVFGTLPVDYALPEETLLGCNFLQDSRCPISEGEDVIYNFQLPLADWYPKITLDIELALFDQDNNIINCASVPISVVDAVAPVDP